MSNWISVNERLPDNDSKVLITAKCKLDGELEIAISAWADAHFGGKSLGVKEWVRPWDYFNSNYDVIAWMPLPKPYKEE